MRFEFLDEKYQYCATVDDEGDFFLHENQAAVVWFEPDQALKLLAFLQKHEAFLREQQEKRHGH